MICFKNLNQICSILFGCLFVSSCSFQQVDLSRIFSDQGRSQSLSETSYFLSQTSSSTKTTSDSKALWPQVGALLKTSMLDCPERVWPGFDFKQINVLMLKEGEPSLVWRGATGALEEVLESDLPPLVRQGLYGFHFWQGQNTVSVFIDKSPTSEYFSNSPEELFGLIVHEAFHAYGQKNWISSGRGKRGTYYPVESGPRISRRMAFDFLLEAFFKSNFQDSLAKSSYWFQNWVNNYPIESKSTTDGYEGTARFVEDISTIVAREGCHASEATLQNAYQETTKELRFYFSVNNFRLDSEGYALGSLAAATLRFKTKGSNWTEAMKTGKTPVDLLLGQLPAIKTDVSPEVLGPYESKAQEINSTISKWIEPQIDLFEKKESIRVVFPSYSMQGSYSPRGFTLHKVKSGETVTFSPFAQAYSFIGKEWKTEVGVDRVLVSAKHPCGSGSFATILNPNDVTLVENKIEFALSDLRGEMIFEKKIDEAGFSWLCGL